MKRLILASASPRRRELLEQIGLNFEVIPSTCEEMITKENPGEVVEELSRQTAEDVAERITEGIVIGSDTVVYHAGRILGKPVDREDAKAMLQRLQGGAHSVFTGVTVIIKENGNKNCHTFFQETQVYVLPMTGEEIEQYLDTKEPMDKAGAYGIQGRFAAWIEKIEGDYNTVVGLPVSALWQVLKKYME